MSRTRRRYAPGSPALLKKSHPHIDKRRQEKYKDDLMDLDDTGTEEEDKLRDMKIENDLDCGIWDEKDQEEMEAREAYWRELEGEH